MFFQSTFTECPLCARHCARLWEYKRKKDLKFLTLYRNRRPNNQLQYGRKSTVTQTNIGAMEAQSIPKPEWKGPGWLPKEGDVSDESHI